MKDIKKKAIYFLQIAMSLTIIILIFNAIDFKLLCSYLKKIHFSTILFLLFVSFLKHLTQFINWKRLLHLNKNYVSNYKELAKSYVIGLSLRFLAPGGLAMFGKVYFVKNSKKASIFSVGLEKLIMSWGNVFAASVASIFYFPEINIYLKIFISFIIGILPFSFYFIKIFLKKESQKTFFKEYKKNIWKLLSVQLIYICLTFIQFHSLLRIFSDIAFKNTIIATSIVIFSHVIPITISGLGLREIFSMKIFEKFGVNPELAVAASLLIFFVNSALPGILGTFLLIKLPKK